MSRIDDFKQKEVINVSDGRRLGFVSDIEVSFEEGRIESIIIPGGGKFFGIIGKDSEVIIPWERIRKIGEDIILVDMDDRSLRKYFE